MFRNKHHLSGSSSSLRGSPETRILAERLRGAAIQLHICAVTCALATPRDVPGCLKESWSLANVHGLMDRLCVPCQSGAYMV